MELAYHLGVSRDVYEGGDVGSNVSLVELAGFARGGVVRVAGLCVNPVVGDHIFEGVVHEAAHTSQVVLWQWSQLSILDCCGEISHLTSFLEQSTRFCSLSETSFPLDLK